MLELSVALTEMFLAVTDDCVALDWPLPMAAETVLEMLLIVVPPTPANCPVARPKPIVTAWILEESTALTLTLPLLPAVIRTLAI